MTIVRAAGGARVWFFGATLAAAVAGGLVLGMLVPTIVIDEGFRRDFFTSAGFAGSAALAAAIVAYVATRRTTNSNVEQAQADRALTERRDRKAQWWARAEWALNQVTSGDMQAAVTGIRVLEALSASEWATEHEVEIVAAALDYALEAGESRPKTRSDANASTRFEDSTSGPPRETMQEGGDDA